MRSSDTTKICHVCKHKYSYQSLSFDSALGAEDLDHRSPPNHRNTMHFWLEECPHCGYVAPDISSFAVVPRLLLKTRSYKSCDNTPFKSELAERFYRRFMICRSWGLFGLEDAFKSLLEAAWCCDDDGDIENAVYCRRKALKYLNALILFSSDLKVKEDRLMVRADVMRRAGLFKEVVKKYQGKTYHDPKVEDTIKFQIEKSIECDDACYTFTDVPTRDGTITIKCWET